MSLIHGHLNTFCLNPPKAKTVPSVAGGRDQKAQDLHMPGSQLGSSFNNQELLSSAAAPHIFPHAAHPYGEAHGTAATSTLGWSPSMFQNTAGDYPVSLLYYLLISQFMGPDYLTADLEIALSPIYPTAAIPCQQRRQPSESCLAHELVHFCAPPCRFGHNTGGTTVWFCAYAKSRRTIRPWGPQHLVGVIPCCRTCKDNEEFDGRVI